MEVTRPVSMVAVVSCLRYDQWEGPGVFQTQTERWISAEKLFLKKRRFHLRTTFHNFQELLKSDPLRIEAREFDGLLWVKAV